MSLLMPKKAKSIHGLGAEFEAEKLNSFHQRNTGGTLSKIKFYKNIVLFMNLHLILIKVHINIIFII